VTSAIDGMDIVPPGIGEVYFIHAVTPESQHSTHYFGVVTRNFRLEAKDLDGALRELDHVTRQQDVVAIEAVEARVDAAAERSRMNCLRARIRRRLK
jgi:vanillate O-demethylase monooxygenase subunit